jgi:hypothetical protein
MTCKNSRPRVNLLLWLSLSCSRALSLVRSLSRLLSHSFGSGSLAMFVFLFMYNFVQAFLHSLFGSVPFALDLSFSLKLGGLSLSLYFSVVGAVAVGAVAVGGICLGAVGVVTEDVVALSVVL